MMMNPTSTLSVSNRPSLVNCGLSEHGLHGREEYELPKLWCLHLYFYEVRMEVSGRPHHILPGSLTVIPPATRIIYHYTGKRHRHFYVHFAIRNGPAPKAQIPICQHLPDAQDELFDRLQNIQRIRTHNPLHAEIAFWALLWDVAESSTLRSRKINQEDAFSKRLEELLETGLPKNASVRALAKQMGLSAAHINRKVKARLGLTTVQLIRKRRLQRAYHLLVHSTMPIKVVAAESGLSDLQQFNKQMRREYGKSPRALRTSHITDPTWSLDRR
jgi:AraC-like DNA-binding protein